MDRDKINALLAHEKPGPLTAAIRTLADELDRYQSNPHDQVRLADEHRVRAQEAQAALAVSEAQREGLAVEAANARAAADGAGPALAEAQQQVHYWRELSGQKSEVIADLQKMLEPVTAERDRLAATADEALRNTAWFQELHRKAKDELSQVRQAHSEAVSDRDRWQGHAVAAREEINRLKAADGNVHDSDD